MTSPRRSRKQWAEQVRAWKASGLSSKAYGAKAGINASTLTWWSWRLSKDPAAAKVVRRRRSSPTFELVELPGGPPASSSATGSRLELDVAGLVVGLPPDFDPDALRRLLEVLEARR